MPGTFSRSLCAVLAAAAGAAAADWFAPTGPEPAMPAPFSVPGAGDVAVSVRFVSPTGAVASVALPPGFALPLASFAAHAPGAAAELDLPPPDPAASAHAGEPAAAVRADIGIRFDAPPAPGTELAVSYRVCGTDVCYPPATVRVPVPGAPVPGPGAAAPEEAAADPFTAALREVGFAKLRVVRTLPHAADAAAFVRFVRGGDADAAPAAPPPPRNRWLYLVSLLLGGFLLNLTPCVLPLVPVNLALLGAGTGRRSRRAGAALGGAFGLGIALCYGALGLFSAATGRAFGFLHGHLAFHVAFAVLFCLLALAMLDAVRLDFSALRNRLPRRRRAAPGAAASLPLWAALARAFAAGAGSALLAGACVAPALVGALLASAELLRTGDPFGAAVPFALGLGMALPWPFLGAGLAVLPKPGRWMLRVKQLFAALFLAAAVHFLLQALRIAVPTAPAEGGWISSPAAAAVAADATDRPVLLALTADWCASCRRMERTVLRDPAVLDATAGAIRLRIDCTDVDSEPVRATMRAVGARGLPFYAILEK